MEFQIFNAVNKFQLFLKISLSLLISFLEVCETPSAEPQPANCADFPKPLFATALHLKKRVRSQI